MRRWRPVVLVAALVLVAAACGDDDDDDDAAGETTTSAAGDEETTTSAGGEEETTTSAEEEGEETTSTEAGGEGVITLDGDPGIPEESGLVPGLQETINELHGTIELFSDDELADGTTRGVTDDTIRVGGVSGITAGGTPILFGHCEGVAARLERANTDGETAHSFEIVDCIDDGTNPDTNEQAVQQMVLDEQVFALLPLTSNAFTTESFVNEERVPYLGWGFLPSYCGYENGWGFGSTGGLVCDPLNQEEGYSLGSPLNMGQYVEVSGDAPQDVRLAAIFEDQPSGRGGVEQFARTAPLAGVDLVYNEASIPPPAAGPVTDWLPFVNALLDVDPTIVFVTTTGTPGLYEALRNAGYTGDTLGFVFGDPGVLLAPELAAQIDGSYQSLQGVGSIAFGGPDWEQVQADAEAVGFPPDLTGSAFTYAYAAADQFVAMVAATEAAAEEQDVPFSAELFWNTVNGGFFYEGLGNVVCGGEWPAMHYGGQPCNAMVRIDAAAGELAPEQDITFYPYYWTEV